MFAIYSMIEWGLVSNDINPSRRVEGLKNYCRISIDCSGTCWVHPMLILSSMGPTC